VIEDQVVISGQIIMDYYYYIWYE